MSRNIDHSFDCKRWYLAFSYAKTMLQKAQGSCPCCSVKRSKASLSRPKTEGVNDTPRRPGEVLTGP